MLRFAFKALAESVVATYASSILTYFLSFGLVLLSGRHRWVDLILTSPTFLLPAAAGAVLAYVLRNHISKASYFAWAVPGVLFVRAFLEVARSPYATGSNTWDTLLGTNCGSSECLYQALFTLPLVCGLSYSVSSVCIRTTRRTTAPVIENTAKQA
jgi:hypothetical protein